VLCKNEFKKGVYPQVTKDEGNRILFRSPLTSLYNIPENVKGLNSVFVARLKSLIYFLLNFGRLWCNCWWRIKKDMIKHKTKNKEKYKCGMKGLQSSYLFSFISNPSPL